jgi:hypothetical protein
MKSFSKFICEFPLPIWVVIFFLPILLPIFFLLFSLRLLRRRGPSLGGLKLVVVEGCISANDWSVFSVRESKPWKVESVYLPKHLEPHCKIKSLWIGPPKRLSDVDSSLGFGVALPEDEIHVAVINQSSRAQHVVVLLSGREIR